MAWSAVQGHDTLVESFARAADRGRLAHAYLFVGPAGIGKRLFSRQFAKTLLCESPLADRWDSCDRCPACLLVDGGTHPDLFFASRPEDKHELPIAVIQQLCSDLALKPARGQRKFAILDDADDLNEESSNAFLKNLEEPPPGSILALVGTNADRQLPTIRSRCQVIPFAPLSIKLIESLLQADAECDAAEAARLARISGGSPGLARELADKSLWEFRCRMLDALSRPSADSQELSKSWMDIVTEVGKDTAAQRRRASLILRLIVDGLRQAIVGKGSSAGADDVRRFAALRQRLGPDGFVRLIERCLAADEQIERRVQLVLVIEALVDSLFVSASVEA